MLLAGIAAAGVMGVGLGLWARPAVSERQAALPMLAKTRAAALTAPRSLQIVIDDTPAPLGALIEVLPAGGAAPKPVVPPPQLPPALIAPVRPAQGLVRVQSVQSDPEAPAPAPRPAPTVQKAVPRLTSKPVRAQKINLVEKPKAAAAKVAKAEPRHSARAMVVVAKVERRAATAARAPKRLLRAVARPAAHRADPAAKLQRTKLQAPKAKPAKLPRASIRKVAAKAMPVKVAPPKASRALKGAGPVRVAKAMPRPDPAIHEADRQMDRAYSSARAAGVPDWQLRRQQARWEQARANAAREAPWAVRDVYLARIAELHDLTKDAQVSGY
jgi:hypothetical protein